MTSVSNLCFALVIAGLLTAGAGAQSAGVAGMEGSGPQPKSSTLTVTIPPAASCPISMRAQHGVDGSMIAVSGAVHKGLGQQLKLTLNNPGNTTVSAIRIAVHGWDGNPAALPAAVASSNRTNASQTIELKSPIAPHQTTHANLWVRGLSSVDSIDLIEVRYARGLSWRASASHACRILPDKEMLISHR